MDAGKTYAIETWNFLTNNWVVFSTGLTRADAIAFGNTLGRPFRLFVEMAS